jgi:predicted DNA-binding transcriptional regulator AlpA
MMSLGELSGMIEIEQFTFNEKRSAAYIGVSDATLRLWRSKGEGPRYFKAGEKLIRYRKGDLDSWIEARLSTSAMEPQQ